MLISSRARKRNTRSFAKPTSDSPAMAQSKQAW
jgi:hypothetical protein